MLTVVLSLCFVLSSRAFTYLCNAIPDFTDNGLINIIRYGEDFYASSEVNYLNEIDPMTLETVRKVSSIWVIKSFLGNLTWLAVTSPPSCKLTHRSTTGTTLLWTWRPHTLTMMMRATPTTWAQPSWPLENPNMSSSRSQSMHQVSETVSFWDYTLSYGLPLFTWHGLSYCIF